MLIVLLMLAAVSLYVYTVRRAYRDADTLPTSEAALLYLADTRQHASTSLRAAILRADRVTQVAMTATFTAAMLLAITLGGPIAALLMALAISVCVAPVLYYRLKTRREIHSLLAAAQEPSGTVLYVPEDWQR